MRSGEPAAGAVVARPHRGTSRARTQGRSDVDLDAVGRAQAAESALRLAAMGPAAVVSSDLRRASDTAAALSRLTGSTPTYDCRLREVDSAPRGAHAGRGGS